MSVRRGRPNRNPVGRGVEGDLGGKSRRKVRECLAEGWCCQAATDFPSTKDLRPNGTAAESTNRYRYAGGEGRMH